MSLSSRRLIDFLEEIDKQLDSRVTLVAAGGTAMTLHGLKPSTIDVDFTGPGPDLDLFKTAVRRIQPGFKVDMWPDGQVLTQLLPPDYLKKSKLIKTRLRRIELRALDPVDIVVTKLGRLDGRDFDDIRACVKAHKLTKRKIVERAKKTQYSGNQNVYDQNLKDITRDLFGPAKRATRS